MSASWQPIRKTGRVATETTKSAVVCATGVEIRHPYGLVSMALVRGS